MSSRSEQRREEGSEMSNVTFEEERIGKKQRGEERVKIESVYS